MLSIKSKIKPDKKRQKLLKMIKDQGLTHEKQIEALKDLQEFVKTNPLIPLDEMRRNAWR